MRIISLGSFWAVNHFAGFCHVVAQMIMINETLLLIASKNIFHSQNCLVMDGSALKHFKHPGYKNALEGTFRCHMHAFIF